MAPVLPTIKAHWMPFGGYARKFRRKPWKKLNIAVIVNPGEESGSPASRAFMDEQAKKTDIALVYEPGRPDNGFVRSRKVSMFLTINFHGRPAHAGNNPQDGRNAIEAMAKAIPEIKAIASEYKDVTLNADVVKGGTTPNTIAEDATVVFDFRFFNDQTRDAVLSWSMLPRALLYRIQKNLRN